MSNHGNDVSNLEERLRNMTKNLELGATKRYPEGKLTAGDEGEIAIGVGDTDGKVVLHFGKEIAWIGMTPEQAEQLGISLIQRAGYLKMSKP